MADIKSELTEEVIKKIVAENKGKLPREIADILISKMVGENNSDKLCGFDLKTIQNLDLSGICHILIAATRYYDYDRPVVHIDSLNGPLGVLADKLEIPLENQFDAISDAVDNYRICGKVEIEDDTFMRFKMSRSHAKKELSAYQEYYGIDKVKLIRKTVREGVR
ncbi:MAG: hypothetical protein E7168_02530 [Firmicutes bacterium]|nr:hypothetical protein [Bacillota bacterium]